MVQGKKVGDMSNGTPKYQQPNMAFPRKDGADARGGSTSRNEGRQNGNPSSFRTDSAISGARAQGERPLQRWQSDAPGNSDGPLESMRIKSSNGGVWDQFAENERLFGLKTDYNDEIYTTKIDKSHPDYRQRLADADRKARDINSVAPTNSHVAEERIQDHVGGDNGVDEEDKYSGVRRQQQDFPPLTSSSNKYTLPARRAPTGQSTVSGAPVDPAIISSQLARSEKPNKPTTETKAAPAPVPAPKAPKAEIATPPTTTESSFAATPEPKTTAPKASTPASRTDSPPVKNKDAPNATATVERDVSLAFKTFAVQQRNNVEKIRATRLRNDKEIKLNDLKKFADSFKLTTPVPSDLVSIIAKDPAKQKEIQEKAKRNAEQSKANPEAAKPIVPIQEAKPAPRPAPATHGSSSSNPSNRQNAARNPAFASQGPYRGSSQAPPQPIPAQQSRLPNLGRNLRASEANHLSKMSQPTPTHEARLPPTGPANSVDPNFSRRSSGVASAQGARLNPNSSEFRPSPHAATFSPHGNPSSGSSPRSTANAAVTPITRSLLRRKPVKPAERPKLDGKFDALSFIKTIKPGPEKKWELNGGMKPAYDTHPAWRQVQGDEKPDSTMQLTYTKLFEMAPFPVQPMSSPGPAHVIPQQPHQHQLPFHLQQGVHNMQPGRSPRAPPMNLHSNQLAHGPAPGFNSHDDHRMMPSHSAQSYASPRLQNVNMAYPSPMNQSAQLAYNPQMMQYPGGPPMQPQFRSLSQSHQFMPQQGPMGPIMMQNPAGGFLTTQGMAPGPGMMYPPGQAPFMPPGNGHPPPMPTNGFPNSPGRSAPMMMNQGSQQGHQQPIYGMNPGMSPGPQYGNVAPIYAQQPPAAIPMRGYGGPNQFGTSPQQMHHFGPQHRNNHPNGSYNNKNFQPHGQHSNGAANNQIPTGPHARTSEGNEETK